MENLAAASFPIQLAGEEYHLSPLSERDIEELDHWMQADLIRIARSGLTDDMTPAEREEVLGAAIREASRVQWFSADGARRMRSADGIARVLWQGLRKRHPELTYKRVRELVVDAKTIQYAMTVFRKVNDLEKKKETTQENGSPKEAGRSPEESATPG